MKASLEESNFEQYVAEVLTIMQRDNCSQLNAEIRHARENEPDNAELIAHKQEELIKTIQEIETMIEKNYSRALIQEILNAKVKV